VATNIDSCFRDHYQEVSDSLGAVDFYRYRSLVAFGGQAQVGQWQRGAVRNQNFVYPLIFLHTGPDYLDVGYCLEDRQRR
jgi:hypothetical protein